MTAGPIRSAHSESMNKINETLSIEKAINGETFIDLLFINCLLRYTCSAAEWITSTLGKIWF
jgi:hypothetical protein